MPSDKTVRIRLTADLDAKSVDGAFSRMFGTLTTAGAAGTSTLEKMRGLLGGMRDLSVGLAASLYTAEKAFRALGAAVVDPFKNLVDSTERVRIFRMQLSGLVSGMSNARQVSDALTGTWRNLPVSLEQLRQTGEFSARVSALQPGLSLSSPGAAASNIAGLSDLITRLQILSPEKTSEAIASGLEKALQGNPRGLRSIGLDPRDLSSVSGRSVSYLQSNQSELLRAVHDLVQQRVPDATLRERGNLVSIQWQKLKDEFSLALEKIGDGPAGGTGIFDRLVSRLRTSFEAAFDYIDSPAYTEHAKSISASLGTILDSTFSALTRGLAALAGEKDLASTPEGVVSGIDKALGRFAEWSKVLPDLAPKVGNQLHLITGALSEFVGDLQETAVLIRRIRQNGPFGASSEQGSDALEIANHRIAIDNLLGKQGIRGLRDRTGMQAVSDVWWSPELAGNDPYLQEKLGFLNAAGDAFRTSSNKMVVPTYAYRSEAAKQAITRAELATTGFAQEGGQFVNPAGVLRALQEQGLLSPLVNLAKLTNGYTSPGPATRPAAGPPPPYQLPADERARWQSVYAPFADEGLTGPNLYANKFSSLNRLVSTFGNILPESSDRLSEDLTHGRGFLDSIFQQFKLDPKSKGEQPGDFFAKISEWKDAQNQALQTEIDHIRTDIEPGLSASDAKGLENSYVLGLQRSQKLLLDGYDSANENAVRGLKEATARYEMKLVGDLGSESPSLRAAWLSRILGGNDSAQLRVGFRFGLTDQQRAEQLGLNAFPAAEQVKLLNELRDTSAQRIDQSARYGGLVDPSMSGRAIEQQALSPLADRQVTEQQIALLENILGRQEGLYERFRQLSAANPGNEEFARAAFNAGDSLANSAAHLRELKKSVNEVQQAWDQFGASSREAITSTLGGAIDRALHGTGTLKAALLDLSNSVIRAFSDMASKLLVQNLIGDFLQPQKSGGTGGIGGLLGNLFGGSSGASASTAAAGDGAVWPSFTPFHAYALGGVANRPTLGLVGERPGVSEAIIPMTSAGRVPFEWGPSGPSAVLPGGRRIPASMLGSGPGDGGVTIHNVIVKDRAAAEQEKARIQATDATAVVNIIADDINRGGKVHGALKRKPF